MTNGMISILPLSTYKNNGSYHWSNLEIGLTTGVTGQQGMFIPPWRHSHLWYIQRTVYAHSLICISYRTYEIDYCSLLLSFHICVATSHYHLHMAYILIYNIFNIYNIFKVVFTIYLHLVLFRTIYYYKVAVWFIGPYFRRHVTLIVNTTSQYESTPRCIVNSFVTSYRLCQRFFEIATHPEEQDAQLRYNVILKKNILKKIIFIMYI
jgi:hypothetical protein